MLPVAAECVSAVAASADHEQLGGDRTVEHDGRGPIVAADGSVARTVIAPWVVFRRPVGVEDSVGQAAWVLGDSLPVAAGHVAGGVPAPRNAGATKFEAAAEDRSVATLDTGLPGREQHVSVLEQPRVEP